MANTKNQFIRRDADVPLKRVDGDEQSTSFPTLHSRQALITCKTHAKTVSKNSERDLRERREEKERDSESVTQRA